MLDQMSFLLNVTNIEVVLVLLNACVSHVTFYIIEHVKTKANQYSNQNELCPKLCMKELLGLLMFVT